jgi:TATA-box binding protein (TBP) (component of TFIID and TFIIIB)
MVYGFGGYKPLYDEDKFFPDLKIKPIKPYTSNKKMENTTSTIASSFNQKVNTDLIERYLVDPRISIKKTKFFNQVTIAIKLPYKSGLVKTVNMKIFTYTNPGIEEKCDADIGTIHMTGARTIKESKLAVAHLITVIKNLSFRVILDGKPTGKCIYAVDDIDSLSIENMTFKYFMHNCLFELPPYCYGSFYTILKNEGYDVSFNPNVYAGIVLKVVIQGVKVSYILFRSGKTTTSISCPGDVDIRGLKTEIYNSIESLYRKHYLDIQPSVYVIPTRKATPTRKK